MPGKHGTLEERFWPKVQKSDGCWLWTAAQNGDGYGRFDNMAAHRFSYALAHGDIPQGMCVLHRCDVRNCVRPDHLFVGTNADNLRDMAAKGRSMRGEKQHCVKLTEDDVRWLREWHAAGWPKRRLAHAVGRGVTTVCAVIGKRTWKHVV